MNKHIAASEVRVKSEPTANAFGWKAIDPEFDAAVMKCALQVCPLGWDVADVAPQTYEELRALLDSGQRMKVWSGASGLTIFGSPDVNYAFRAWHDFHHWNGKYPFTLVGEAATVWAQAQHLREVYGGHPRERLWRSYMYAEIMGQAIHADLNGAFPENQRAFAKDFSAVVYL